MNQTVDREKNLLLDILGAKPLDQSFLMEIIKKREKERIFKACVFHSMENFQGSRFDRNLQLRKVSWIKITAIIRKSRKIKEL